MNIHQKHLLDILKEVDAFCREHGITYYCAGGTVIGAARHHGFIPWDDDIDIYMTRENFFKFDEALKRYGPSDRKLEYYEGNHERQAAVARYHKEDDTMFCHFNLLGYSSAGTSIDVFILDPLPDSHDARVDYFAGLFAYSDLISPCHVYSHRLPTSKFDVYDKYKKIADTEGRERAVELISEELFHYTPEECSCYCLRWGSVLLIYPVEVIGEPTYLPFEDMMIPVPHDWYRYLAIHYGMDWADLPYEETQGEHINIVRYDMGYDYFYKKRDELFEQDYLLDLHFRWKDAERNFFRAAEPIETFVKETQDRICRETLNKRLLQTCEETKKNDCSENTPKTALEALFEAGNYDKITEIYRPYLDLQQSHAYMGRQMRHGTQFRWLFPHIMPLDEGEMKMLLTSMLRTGQQRTVEKIVGIYSRAGIESDAVSESAKVVDLINAGRRAYYLGEYEEACRMVAESGLAKMVPALEDLLWLADVQRGLTEEQASELAVKAAKGSSDSIRKAWGDYLWKQGKSYDAKNVYKNLMKNCRNGLFWMDIQEKVPDIDPIPTKKLTPFTETALTLKQRELLEEIASICKDHDIRYVIGQDLARRIYLTGNIGYVNANREIFMDAENAAKFMEAFKSLGRSDRKLMSWSSGDRVRDFALVYSDVNNVYCDFRRLDQWRDMGIYITIRILRSGNASKKHKRKAMIDEFFVNLIDIEGIDERNLQSASKKMVYKALRALPSGVGGIFKRRAFESSVAAERSAFEDTSGSFYYYTNIRGMKPVKHRFARSMWEDVCETEMNGVCYTMPKSMTAKYVPHETDLANVPPIDSIFIYRSSEMSWDDISPLIDDDAYMTLDWGTYARTRRMFRKLDNEVWHDWWMVLKLGEELDLNDAASEIVAAYKSAAESGRKGETADIMNQVDATVKKYTALGVPIYLEPKLKECYLDYLRQTGQEEFIKTFGSIEACSSKKNNRG